MTEHHMVDSGGRKPRTEASHLRDLIDMWVSALNTDTSTCSLYTNEHAAYLNIEGEVINTQTINDILQSGYSNQLVSCNGSKCSENAVLSIELDSIFYVALKYNAD